MGARNSCETLETKLLFISLSCCCQLKARQAVTRPINAALADSKVAAGLADLGTVLSPGSPADFSRLIAVETAKWGRVVKFSGAKLE